MLKRWKLDVFLPGSLIFIVAQALTFYIAFQAKAFVEENQITSPQAPLGLGLVYFFGVVVLLGIVLFFIPVSKLRLILKLMFAFLFAWGTLIMSLLVMPFVVAAVIAAAAGIAWFLAPRVWLHNTLMIFALVSAGVVFGFMFTPWTVIALMFVLSVYDILAVRFGYMIWMAKRLSESNTLPAFIIPKGFSSWNLDLKRGGFTSLMEGTSAEREFSILGGGDIGLPLLLIVSVFFTYGFTSALMVGVFALGGLISAYWIQLAVLKGKPLPALPPLSIASLIGFLIAQVLI